MNSLAKENDVLLKSKKSLVEENIKLKEVFKKSKLYIEEKKKIIRRKEISYERK